MNDCACAAFGPRAVQFQESTKLWAVTGVPSWNVQPGLILMVKVLLSVVVIESATRSDVWPVLTSYFTSPANRASITSPPFCSVVLPGINGFSGSPHSTLTVWADRSSPPPPPPHAVATSATASAAATMVTRRRNGNVPPRVRRRPLAEGNRMVTTRDLAAGNLGVSLEGGNTSG